MINNMIISGSYISKSTEPSNPFVGVITISVSVLSYNLSSIKNMRKKCDPGSREFSSVFSPGAYP